MAMSRFGERLLRQGGLYPSYIPHAVDRSVYRPLDGSKTRAACGVDDGTFVVGLCAANRDVFRKGFTEQFQAFAQFAARHPDSLLLVHTAAEQSDALDLGQLATACGIADKVIFPDQHALISGLITGAEMAQWYSMLDVLSACSYAEGFGLPIIEAQACGVPVVVTDFGPMTELCGAGWTVPGQPFWVRVKQGWWCQPDVQKMADAYEDAWQARENGEMTALKAKALDFAAGYDSERVRDEYWVPALAEIEFRLLSGAER